MVSRLYTTREVAKRAGVSRQTLQAWIAEQRIKAPAVIRAAGVRLWTETDLAPKSETAQLSPEGQEGPLKDEAAQCW
jgi:excisionase family DNA binding protein